MMTVEEPNDAFVWTWPSDSTDPVLAGRIDGADDLVTFTYEPEYLARQDAVPLYLPELPLTSSPIRPPGLRRVAGVVEDAAPAAWGQRIVMRYLLGHAAEDADPATLGLLTYILETGSDRIGALDFQRSAEPYTPRLYPRLGLDPAGRRRRAAVR
jgi:serine/threonine-protein kinase HipA